MPAVKIRPVLAAALLLVASCAQAPERRIASPEPARPEPQMAVTANPLATRAAIDMLEKGGSAIDAAFAAQLVLGLVEPQSSGLGGGTLILHWDSAAKKLASFDGLAAAPARVTASLRTDADGKLLESEPSQRGGRTVGVPGTLPVFGLVHSRYGKLPWRVVFAPAIALAEKGFPLPPYLHDVLIADRNALKENPDIAPHYFGADGEPLPVGTPVRNPEYARTLRRIAEEGPEGLFSAEGAQAIVASARRGFRPTLMTEQDLRDYRAVERRPLCAPFLVYTVCTVAPPSFGGLAVLQILQIVEERGNGRYDFDDDAFVHLYAEAGKLAQADRRQFVGDPDFVRVPIAELASREYARQRAALIDPERDHGEPAPGAPVKLADSRAPDESDPPTATSQIAVVDRNGNAASITTTINLNFGSRLMVRGFVLNNAMTNFSAAPRPGETIANQMAPRKRPVTAMAPTIVFDREGAPFAIGGTAGGGPLVDYVAATLIEMLANGRTPAQAQARGHVTTAVRGSLELEKDTPAASLAPALRSRGHDVRVVPLRSGLAFIKREAPGWIGAADPRRDGAAFGY